MVRIAVRRWPIQNDLERFLDSLVGPIANSRAMCGRLFKCLSSVSVGANRLDARLTSYKSASGPGGAFSTAQLRQQTRAGGRWNWRGRHSASRHTEHLIPGVSACRSWRAFFSQSVGLFSDALQFVSLPPAHADEILRVRQPDAVSRASAFGWRLCDPGS